MTYLNDLFKRFIEGRCTEEELSVLLRHFELEQYSGQLDKLVAEELAKEVDEQGFSDELDEIVAHNRAALRERNKMRQRRKPVVRSLKVLLPIAGLVLFASAIALYVHLNPPNSAITAVKHDVPPGTNRAFITLSDGQNIELSEQKNKIVIGNHAIEYSDGGEIAQTGEVQYAVLTTPRAGQYQLRLPDGTQVWLNAESSLRYPLPFTGSIRKVELTGEAYFEVAKSVDAQGQRVPFIVKGANHSVEVHGTRFNVNGYPGDEVMQTALLEGSVRVSTERDPEGYVLQPGQLASVQNGTIEVGPADIDAITAWTKGDFVFNQEDLQSVMKKIARWYDVEVIYPATQPDIRFSGAISRSRNLSAVLKMMEMTGEVSFKIEGRRVVVMR